MKLSWENITVQQFQDIYRLSLNTDLDDLDKVDRVICILYDITEDALMELPQSDYVNKAKEVAFIMNSKKIPGKPKRKIQGAKNKYLINYDPARLRHRQYVEIVTYGEKPIENMHLLMASIVEPMNWLGLKRKNDVLEHESIATDLLDSPVVDVYHAAVFFCKLYVNLIKATKDSLVAEMMQKMTKQEAESLLEISLNAMDGFIQQNSSQTSRM